MVTDSAPFVSPVVTAHWRACYIHALERLPIRPRWLILSFLLAGIVHTYLTLYLQQDFTRSGASEPVASILVSTFILIYFQLVKRRSIRALGELRPVIPIPEERYQRYARMLLHADPRVELLMLVVSVAAIVALQRATYPRWPTTFLGWFASVFTVLFGILSLWILLALIYNAIRSSLALRGLARSPLIVNAFDPTGLLPFGQLAAYHGIATVIVVSIPMILIGQPGAAGAYSVLALSFVSLAVLFVPIWGVHRQIVLTRQRVLETLADDLMEVQTRLLASNQPRIEDLAAIHQEAERLTDLRKLVLSGPTWPFRDYGTVLRVVTAVFLPTLLTFIGLVIENKVFR